MTPEQLATLMMTEVKRSAYVQYEADDERGEPPDLSDILVDGHVNFLRVARAVLAAMERSAT